MSLGEADAGWWLSTHGDGHGGSQHMVVVVMLHHSTSQVVASPWLPSLLCSTGKLNCLRLIVRVVGMVTVCGVRCC